VDVGTLIDIFEHGQPVLPSEDLIVEIEYEYSYVSQFALSEVRNEAESIALIFESKHTDCLAKDVCGIPDAEDESCCSPSSGCC
jgi:hypothetical protein